MVSRTMLTRFIAFLQGGSTIDHKIIIICPVQRIYSPSHNHQGSYVAVSGTPGRGSVHVVEGVPALAGGSVTVVNGVRVCSEIFSNAYNNYYIFSSPFQSVSHHGGSHVAAVPHHPLPQVDSHLTAWFYNMHTWYLSFFLHKHNFWINFSPHKSA